MKKIFFSFILLLPLLSIGNPTQSLRDHKYLEYINSLEKNQLYKSALVEYKRFLFTNPSLDETERGLIFCKIARIYKNLNDDVNLIIYLTKSFNLLKNTQELNRVFEELTLFYLAKGKSTKAKYFLDKLDPSPKKTNYQMVYCLFISDWENLTRILHENKFSKNQMNRINLQIQDIIKLTTQYKKTEKSIFLFPSLTMAIYSDLNVIFEDLPINYLLIQNLFSEISVAGKILSGLRYVLLSLKRHRIYKDKVLKKLQNKIRKREEKIFDIIFK